MARTVLGFVLLALALVGAFGKDGCEAETSEVARLKTEAGELRQKLNTVEDEIERLAQGQGGVELSVTSVVASAGTFASSMFQRALDGTGIDEKVAEKASTHFGAARSVAVDAMARITAIDYGGHADKLKQHDLYKAHVAPALEKVTKMAEPYMASHVNPAIDAYVHPVVAKAKAATTQISDTVLPGLQEHKTKVMGVVSDAPAFFGKLEAKLGEAIAPAFEFVAKVSPMHATVLPSRPVDRLLLILITLLSSYYFLFLAKFVVTLALRLTSKTTSIAFKLAVVLPLRIALRLLSGIVFFATCFYCCGLCRRRPAQVSKKSSKAEKATASKENKKTEKATAEELKQLLEASKKKGKLDDAVKLLCTREKECKPMEGKSFPENVRGKMLDKATLKKAFAHFKEIDSKKL